VLAAEQEQACRQLSSRSGDRFAELEWRATADGAILLDGASAWLECSIHAQHRAGDHDIVVLSVHELDADHGITPLVFHASRFRSLAG
jgi:flavin reductase (DIM6/NTAB) family NADH-FMN oxidoreductase RutF